MALFKRPTLKEKGLTDEQIEWLLTESNRVLAANYMPKSDLQEQIDAAVAAAKKDLPQSTKIEDSDEYKAVVAERDMLRAIGGEEFSSIKPKFRETVYGMIQRGEDAPSLADQLGQVKEQYEEYFVEADPKPKNTPVFSKPGGSVQTNETEEDKLYAKLLEHWDK